VSPINNEFLLVALTPAGFPDCSIAVAAARAGGLGVLDLEYIVDIHTAIQLTDEMTGNAACRYGIKLNSRDDALVSALTGHMPESIDTIILTWGGPECVKQLVNEFHLRGRRVFLEVTSADRAVCGQELGVDGLLVKGSEAGGIVGEKTAFILLQQVISGISLPVLVQGGIGLHTAGACYAAGAAGVVLDSQLLLATESPLSGDVKKHLAKMNGGEPRIFGENTSAPCRLYIRPGSPPWAEVCKIMAGEPEDEEQGARARWQEFIRRHLSWNDAKSPMWLIGQDVALASGLARKYRTVGSIIQAVQQSALDPSRKAGARLILQKDSPLAKSHGTPYPVVQGPMARVSDNPEFAHCVSKAGGLPFLALSKLKANEIRPLLEKVKRLLGSTPWGVGILGFNEKGLLLEQLDALAGFSPPFAIIAGGLPEQAGLFESMGTKVYFHVPSPEILDIFLLAGAKRFVLEGSECGGHIGPRSSFILWEVMTEKLLEHIKSVGGPEDYHVMYAGGIHDALSASMAAVVAAALIRLGVRIGLQMGTAYLFTQEIVETGAIVSGYQENVLGCSMTSVLESSPGHAIRCCDTAFARKFEAEKRKLLKKKTGTNEIAEVLNTLILGRSRIAAKGLERTASCEKEAGNLPALASVECARQNEEGLYMAGQLAALHDRTLNINDLHENVTARASARLACLTDYEKTREDSNPANIAVIGMACIFPKAGDVRTYWENILGKRNGITEIPPERWDWRLYYDENRGAKDKIYSKWGGFLDDLSFDPTRFGFPPKSVESVDPMQLMALEVAQRALADAGYEDRQFDRERTSVIIGSSGGAGDVGMQYGLRAELPRFQGNLPEAIAGRLPEWSEDTFAGILLNVIAGRIANRMNLGGVNYTTDAACASSLAAVYQAVGELTSGRSSLVLAGGVDTVQGPFGFMCFSKAQALSPRGRCRTFDESADGIVISEGIAMLVLKRLEDARRDGDRIYAVIKGIGGSSDGKAKGLMAPSPAGQLRAMRRAYEQAGFGADTVDLIEAHGTGTAAGDTAELESSTALLEDAGSSPRNVAIGSVKTIIGHTKATAGIASFLKIVLALYHRVLPPHAGVDRPNNVLLRPECPLYLINEAEPWLASKDHPRRAASSAFGFGGTNFHVVLEEHLAGNHPVFSKAANGSWPAELFVWRGCSRNDLSEQLVKTRKLIEETPDGKEFRDLAYKIASSLKPDGETLAIVAADKAGVAARIESALNILKGGSQSPPEGVYLPEGPEPRGKLAVLFPGQGSQYVGMLRELALNFPVIAETLSEADALLSGQFQERFGKNMRLSRFIFPRGLYDGQERAAAEKALTSTDVAQPALGAVEAGLWRLMTTLGLPAGMAAGHSYGEFVSLFASGVIDFQTLMALSEARGRFIVDAVKSAGSELGTMAAIKAARDQVEKMISGIEDVVLANHNAPFECVISGSAKAVEEAIAVAGKAGVNSVRIPVSAAFHSRFIEPARSPLAELIEKTAWRKSQIPVYSNTTGQMHAPDTERMKRAMADHMVKPVEFQAEIEAMHRDGARTFLELGPKSVLTRLTDKILDGHPHRTIAVDGGEGGVSGLLHALAQLLAAGYKLDIIRLFEGCCPADLNGSNAAERGNAAKTVWLLNGSGARRADAQPRKIGVTLNELCGSQASPPRDGTRSLPEQGASPVKDNFKKGGGRKMPNEPDAPVMEAYFEMMKKFLETQERVVSMYISGGAPNLRRPAVRQPGHMLSQLRQNAATEDRILPNMDTPLPQEGPAGLPEKFAERPGAAAAIFRKTDVEVPAAAEKGPSCPGDGSKNQQGGIGRNAGNEHVGRREISDMLLHVIEEKTGYPPDMIGLDQNLEADLGIDSIKRVEIVSALLKGLPPDYAKAFGNQLSELTTQPTLDRMLDLLEKTGLKGADTRPFDYAGAGPAVSGGSHSFRHVVRPVEEPIAPHAPKRLGPGHFIITSDTLNVAEELARMLCAHGCTAGIVGREVLKDEELLDQWTLSKGSGIVPIAGIVHLVQIGSGWLSAEAPARVWRDQLQLNEKSLFMLLKNLGGKLAPNAHILSASALGGLFNRDGNISAGFSLQAGAVGLLKTFGKERPGLRVKAVDVDPAQPAGAIARNLLDELELDGGRQEVGYPGGKRTVFHTVAEAVVPPKEILELPGGLVVLATGGLKGVTAELLRELALPGNTLIITGRSNLQDEEPVELKNLEVDEALRRHFINEAREKGLRMSPADIRRKIKSVLAAREMRDNLRDFRKRGAAVEYHAVDVIDEDAMKRLLDGIYLRHPGIGAVIHGAGIIEDKLLADKSGESWSRVVETKVLGLLLLCKYLRPESLRFLAVMSSVAGRYGNTGQADYAAANELMNRLCCQMSADWAGKVNVKALCWGPWGPTAFGTGMVGPETEAKFAAMGITLVSADAGRKLFREEMVSGSPDIEIVCGEAPWEEHEAALVKVLENRDTPAAAMGVLLSGATVTNYSNDKKTVSSILGDDHDYLKDHRIDGIRVLPAAAALEIMSEAARHLWPGQVLIEIRDFRLLKGIELKGKELELHVPVSPGENGVGGAFEVNAAIRSVHNGSERLHYRSVITFGQKYPETFKYKRPQANGQSPKKLSAADAYAEWLFHGPRFQVIEDIEGIWEHGARTLIRTSSPSGWMPAAEAEGRGWVCDPAVIDAAAQMAILWARAYRNETALPARFGRVVLYCESLPERVFMNFELRKTGEPHSVRANVYYTDPSDDVLLMIEDMECICSVALNRLGGSAKLNANAS